ncbi:MAG: hypothetical protein M1833_007334 [Piccolia ochrophora]|nr:MAG: hypothetical protein M1833_007334 [Piccolia ochrophora]
MNSPFAPSASRPGHGTIDVKLFPPAVPVLSAFSYTYPLKLISPTPNAGAKALLIFLLTYGGGLVAGDRIDLSVTIAASARLALVTQGSTKIFKAPNPEIVSKQSLQVRIKSDGALLYLPDPVQPFKESVYEQRQTFTVDSYKGSLCVLDWVSEGRTARQEKWNLWQWKGKNEVWSLGEIDGGEAHRRLLLRDNIVLDGLPSTQFSSSLEQRMDGMGVFGTLIIRGPLFDSLASFFINEFAALPRIGGRDWSSGADKRQLSSVEEKRYNREQRGRDGALLWTAAALRGFVLVKFGAREVETARRWLGSMLKEEKSVEAEFGEGSLLCLK